VSTIVELVGFTTAESRPTFLKGWAPRAMAALGRGAAGVVLAERVGLTGFSFLTRAEWPVARFAAEAAGSALRVVGRDRLGLVSSRRGLVKVVALTRGVAEQTLIDLAAAHDRQLGAAAYVGDGALGDGWLEIYASPEEAERIEAAVRVALPGAEIARYRDVAALPVGLT
jgi:hypothetical protein